MLVEPPAEELIDRLRQPEENPAGAARARLARGLEDARDLGVVEAGNDRADHDGHRDARAGEGRQGLQPALGSRRARLHAAGEVRIERGDREEHVGGIVRGEGAEEIRVAGDER